ncbi:DUF7309 domain-containing protein [Caldanaerobius polysaccharolyticus]|uniref:DUF7309 domain-containing protein n=1 Tax=Caldanaerobius polysaccharolyticus TaxID=44256 RepID=UPI00047BAE11|nr:hypothetical protein [Caldanaerobius polysaccharolyticus]
MGKKATLDEWRELYKVASEVKELRPWEHLWDMDLITILHPAMSEPVYCSVMGKSGECFCIASYYGFEAFNRLMAMIQRDDIPPEQVIRFQEDNVIICFFGDREELFKEELQIIKDLGLKFRGKNNWIYFRSFKKGYSPYILDEDEVLKETEILKNLYMALQAYIEGKIKVNFGKGMTLLRRYDEETKQWLNCEAPLFSVPPAYKKVFLKDEVSISRLNKQQTINSILELDIAYVQGSIKDKKYERPLSIRICVLADSRTGIVLDQKLLSPKDDEISEILRMIIDYILQTGKPKRVYVRDEYIRSIIEDICNNINIELKIRGRLNAIDNFIKILEQRGF